MAKVKNLGLYIGLLCTIGIMAVFFFDAYIGVYDTLYLTEEGWEREMIAFDRPYPKYIGADYGETLYFSYEITNHEFKEYNTYIEASVWRKGKEKVLTLFSANKSIKPFENITLEWVLESEKLEPNTNYLLKIKTDDFERIVHMVFHQITIATPEIIPIPLTEPEIGKGG
jgi:hypothetical protein